MTRTKHIQCLAKLAMVALLASMATVPKVRAAAAPNPAYFVACEGAVAALDAVCGTANGTFLDQCAESAGAITCTATSQAFSGAVQLNWNNTCDDKGGTAIANVAEMTCEFL